MTERMRYDDPPDRLNDTILESRYDMGSGSTTSRIRLALDDGLRADISVTWSAVPDDSGLRREPSIDGIDFRRLYVLQWGEWWEMEPSKDREADMFAEHLAVVGCGPHDAIMALLLDSDIWQETYSGGRL